MAYKYEFDMTSVGDFTLSREDALLLQGCYKQLKAELEDWNKKAIEHGARERPYKQEVDDLSHRIEVTNRWLGENRHRIFLNSVMIGSLRLINAALMLSEYRSRHDLEKKKQEGWPSATVSSLEKSLENLRGLIKDISYEPSEVLWEIIPRQNYTATRQTVSEAVMEHDVFISHASEDKEGFVRELAEHLRAHGLKVWYDEFTLTVGDSLRRSIDRGLANSRYGVVVLSPDFLKKEWPQRELDGLVAREIDGVKIILPVWHRLGRQEILAYSPPLADRLGTPTSRGMDSVVHDLLAAIRHDTPNSASSGDSIPSRSTATIDLETIARVPSTFSPYAYWQKDEMLGALGETAETAAHPSQIEDRIEYRYEEPVSFYLRLIPVNKLAQKIKNSTLKAIADKRRLGVLTRTEFGGYPFLNAYGAALIEQAGMSSTPNAITQMFRNGEIWGVSKMFSTTYKSLRLVPMVNVENIFTRVLGNFVAVATQQLNIEPPFLIEMGATGLKDMRLTLPPPQGVFDQFSELVHQPDHKTEFFLTGVTSDEQEQAIDKFIEELYDLVGIGWQKNQVA